MRDATYQKILHVRNAWFIIGVLISLAAIAYVLFFTELVVIHPFLSFGEKIIQGLILVILFSLIFLTVQIPALGLHLLTLREEIRRWK